MINENIKQNLLECEHLILDNYNGEFDFDCKDFTVRANIYSNIKSDFEPRTYLTPAVNSHSGIIIVESAIMINDDNVEVEMNKLERIYLGELLTEKNI